MTGDCVHSPQEKMRDGRRCGMFLTLTLASALLLVPGAARAACREWEMPAKLNIIQSNRSMVELQLQPAEGGFVGKALNGRDGAFISAIRGAVDGAVSGSNVQFTIHWHQSQSIINSTGMYTGTVGPQGRITGTTFDAVHPETTASWWSDGVLQCRVDPPASPPTPTPPPIALGRVKGTAGLGNAPVQSICEAARSARSRNSPAAPGLERQCAAQSPQ